ncbi:MAG: hypothetical protein IPP14_14600 [Planctomycetes bacterium]|nr:hypothetical protein [Planctomycetota bacterium]
MSDLDDIRPLNDPPPASVMGCPVCRNGVALPPDFNLPSVQCPTCGAVFGRLTGQVISGAAAPPSAAWMQPPAGFGPQPPGWTRPGAPRGLAPNPRRGNRAQVAMGLPVSPYRTAWLIAFAVIGLSVVVAAIAMAVASVLGGDESDFTAYEPQDQFEPETDSDIQWLEVRREDFEFSALFPGAFKETSSDRQTKLTCSTQWADFSLLAQKVGKDELTRNRDQLKTCAMVAAKDAAMGQVNTSMACTVAGCPAMLLTGTRIGGGHMSVFVVVAARHRFVLVAQDHAQSEPVVDEFFHSFSPLKPATTEIRKTRPDASDPIYVYYVGTGYCTVGGEFHGVLVARGADSYRWEILENELPEGLQALATDDRVVITGTPVEGAKAGHLKVAAISGKRRTEHLLELEVSR